MPRVAGINVVAVGVAAVAFYLVGVLWYALLFQQIWMELSRLTPADTEGEGWKMALGPIMAIVSVVAIALVYKWKGGSFDVVQGALKAVVLCAGFALPVVAFGYVYAAEPFALFLIDASHLLVAYALSGAILGAFR